MSSMSKRIIKLERNHETPVSSQSGAAPGEVPTPDPALLQLEADLVIEINRLRQQPAGYIASLEDLQHMYNERVLTIPGQLGLLTSEGRSAVDEAMAAIRDASPQSPVTLSEALTQAARVHAADLARGTTLTSVGSDGSLPHERMKRYGLIAGMYAENIAAAYTRADLLVMQLIVDDGMATRANRDHLLAPMFRSVGVGCADHPGYRVVCVIDLAEYFHVE